LAIAFAIASGVSPEKGLVTAVVAGFLISALGGSRVQIGGPTGAFVIIVAGIVAQHGIDGLITATFLAGLILILFGAVGFGGVIKFIPYPVTLGFTSGIAVIIATSQVKESLGLAIQSVPVDFIHKWKVIIENLPTCNWYAVMLCGLTIVMIYGLQKISKRLPYSLIALMLLTIVAMVFKLPVETIGSRFGAIPNSLPLPHFPVLNLGLMREIAPAAFTIAILAGIESLLSAVVADGMIGGKHRSNTELIAQGIANMGSALFGGIPATGAIARTATNVHSGGRTPMAGIVHSIVLVIIMYTCSQFIIYMPLAVLAGILMLVAYRMSEWRSFLMVLRAPRSDVAVLLITFLLTVFVDLTTAIQIGMVLSAFLLINRLSNTPNISVISNDINRPDPLDDSFRIENYDMPAGVEVYDIVGAFFFGVTARFVDMMSNIEKKPRVRILRMRNVLNIDATALNGFRHVIQSSKKNGIVLLISGLHSQPLVALEKAGLLNELGIENLLASTEVALDRAKEIVAIKKVTKK
jgi:SulP family sulfate permease